MVTDEIYAIDMGGGKSSCVILEDVSPTLTCTHYGEPVVMYTLTEKRFFEWHEDEVAVSLRAHSGSYGGGERGVCNKCRNIPLPNG